MQAMSPRSSRPQSARIPQRPGSAEPRSGVTTPPADPVMDGNQGGQISMGMASMEAQAAKGE